jgi:hypothetical protein
MTGRLLTAAEVAELLNVPVSWVRETTRSDAMPHVSLACYKRYQAAAVEKWLEECAKHEIMTHGQEVASAPCG